MAEENLEKTPLLVIGIAGRMGSGTSSVREKLFQTLLTFDYQVEIITISRTILDINYDNIIKSDSDKVDLAGKSPAEKRQELQRRGNKLRSIDPSLITQICVTDIIFPDTQDKKLFEKATKTRRAYIFDSLKHPAEVEYLREIFGDNFYLVGVVASDEKRKERLKEIYDFTDESFENLDEIDAGQKNIESGQQSIKTILQSDYFFQNNYSKKNELNSEADRFFRLVFKINVETPRQGEFGMCAAYNAAKRSGCLSRQVGAAIAGLDGSILANRQE